MRILYAGDSPVGGAANYLLGVMGSIEAEVTHVPPAKPLSKRIAENPYDVILLSDYSCSQVSPDVQKLLARQVDGGAGLMMIGGWASFTGLWGQWKGSVIEGLLPVRCRATDDRLNIPTGAVMLPKSPKHPAISKLTWRSRPVICGVNRVLPRAGKSTVLLSAAELCGHTSNLQDVWLGKEYPLLVASNHPDRRVLALATDVAPHWCGGLVDWGSRRVTLPVNSTISIEVGTGYVAFLSGLLKWLAG